MAHSSSPKTVAGPSLSWLAAAAAALALAACGTTPDGPSSPATPVEGSPPDPVTMGVSVDERPMVAGAVRGSSRVPEGAEFTPPHLQEAADELTRVAVLLPFSASDPAVRSEAGHLMRAAELALFERGGESVVLLPKDTAGTAEGAREAARAAVQDGAGLIVGPLLAPAVEAAGETAREYGVPVIGFSTDGDVAGDGVYLLSFPPSEEVRRVVEYAAGQGVERFAFFGPSTDYGRVASDSYREAVEDAGGRVAGEEFYSPGSDGAGAARRLAALGVERIDARDAARMTGADWEVSENSAFQAVIVADGGDSLRMVAPSMLLAGIDPLAVKYLGTSLWRESGAAREPALDHGWFAGPDPNNRDRFERAYREAYGEAPSRLAGLGYDAASLAVLLGGDGGRVARRGIEAETGFLGVDGLFRFGRDGLIDRGLAVYRVRNGGYEVIDPAPSRFETDRSPDAVEDDQVDDVEQEIDPVLR